MHPHLAPKCYVCTVHASHINSSKSLVGLHKGYVHTLTVDTHLSMAILILYTMNLINHLVSMMDRHWVAVRCEASEATHARSSLKQAKLYEILYAFQHLIVLNTLILHYD